MANAVASAVGEGSGCGVGVLVTGCTVTLDELPPEATTILRGVGVGPGVYVGEGVAVAASAAAVKVGGGLSWLGGFCSGETTSTTGAEAGPAGTTHPASSTASSVRLTS